MARPTANGKRQRGVVFLVLLIVIAAMGASLGAAATLWHEVQLRAREQELLFVGQQFRQAIQRYYETPSGEKKYPQSLEVLLLDERTPAITRHLRRIYRDPISNSLEWGLEMAPQGGIMGVYSLAPGEPIKRANFPSELEWEDGKSSYAEWKFVYVPMATPGVVTAN